jgi:integrase
MKRVWVGKRADRPGKHLVSWYENGRQITRSFPTRQEAEHYRAIKYHELNISLIQTAINMPWSELKKNYLEHYHSLGRAYKTINLIESLLNRIEEYVSPYGSLNINIALLESYISRRQKDNISAWTINRELQLIESFCAWMKSRFYSTITPKFPRRKTSQARRTSAYTDQEIAALLAACPTQEWRLRIVLALVTGLRKMDIYRLPASAVSIDNAWLTTSAKKTGKEHSSPLPETLLPLLKSHIEQLPPNYPHFFHVINYQWLDTQWASFRPGDTFTFQLLRKTHATRIESTGISTAMLGHSSSAVTRKFYNDMDYIKYIRVNQLPIAQWLSF